MSQSIFAESAGRPGRPGPALSVLRAVLQRVSREWRGPGLRVFLPAGETLVAGPLEGAEPIAIRLRSYDTVRRLLTAGDIGFAEGYVAGEWDTPDLARLLTVLADNFDGLERLGLGGSASHVLHLMLKLVRRNTVRGAKRNIYAHYDLGNAFYEAWLDPSMTYSAALFDRPDQDLEAAQGRKYAALARAIDLQPGHEVLEIGCGWGGFAEFAAREVGARATCLTISEAQHAYARQRMQRAGLAGRVDVRLCDYREAAGTFDRVVSIEMFEAVGERYWPVFFDRVRERLRPGGRAGLQIITIRDDLFEQYRSRVDFIQKHIFPGGMLPSEARLRQEAARSGLAWSEPRRFGRDYALTLNRWAERFQAAWPALRLQGFDERFHRLWRFYLAYCEAGFATGRTDVLQAALTRA